MTTLELDFTDFAAAASSIEAASPLTKQLDTLALETKEAVAQANHFSSEIEKALPYPGDILSAIDAWQNQRVKTLLDQTIKLLKEGRDLNLDEDLILQALYGSDYLQDRHGTERLRNAVLGVWDSSKIIAARDNEFGNLEEAEKRKLFRGLAHFIRHPKRQSPHNNETEKDALRQIVLSLHLFSDTYDKGNYRPSYQDRGAQAFLHFQRLIENIASKRPLPQCTPIIPLLLQSREPYRSADLFRWHLFEAPGITRIRVYKEGNVACEVETEEIKQQFLAALDIYTADLQA
jgi:hypothetical protein